ncbi:MAG: recombination mediator RecR [Thermodesulfobacteriota bacterium]
MNFGGAFERLTQQLVKLPGVGKKTAERLAFHILSIKESEARNLAQAILAVKEKLRLCSRCFNFSEQDPCPYCSDIRRDRLVICVVEEPRDLAAIERTGAHKGTYHVLHGLISPLEGVAPEDIKIKELIERIKREGVEEVIMATNPTVEGDATALYLAKLITPLKVKVTRIAQGMPMGGDLEYTDEVTVRMALEGRRVL